MTTNKNEPTKNSQSKDEKVMTSMPKNLMIPVLLLSLRNWNLHGYKLIQELTQFGFSSIDQGNVYRTLRQLEKDDLVKSEWDTTTGGPAKRIYSITDAGEAYLKTCSNSLEQYQSIINRFFTMYMDMFMPTSFTQNDDSKD
ncbi:MULTISPECIES: poly-beta-hydroxybutyrate-responsive repressor [Metabacillus]|uniref:Poly-beta-hydroxybutyrate-responsive repressor n=1 Tax=Metabacillus rhizolycopersici TaxID=2875709 RepID=A0ABS7UTK2_9BACI|nr:MULTISPECIES: poly-beta-hydroxybutyrate-responsive repressor [Metabacillus]MBZ5751640.1 poly-beta-hydroxybutyrate-responsive repressor [Metabacillus rhizolycopersici]